MRQFALKTLVALALVVSALAVAPASAGASEVVVLGDSIAWGCCVPANQQWATIFAQQVGADLENVAIPGATSDDLINDPHTWPSGRTQPQLDEAVDLLGEAAPGSVEAITLDIGGNDLLQLSNSQGVPCFVAPADPECQSLVAAALPVLGENLDTIIDALELAVEPGTPLLVMTYYNPLDDGSSGGVGDLIEPAVQAMNDTIMVQINAHATEHVDAHPYFADRAPELISDDNIHPAAAGHDLLANLFTNEVPPDGDSDGLSDVMEGVFATDPGVAVGDTDGDGCTDLEEFGPVASQGGSRHPAKPWDFFDVPAPVRDKAISGGDIAAIVVRFGANDMGPGDFDRNSDLLSTPNPAVDPAGARANYHPAFDRTGVNQSARPTEREKWDLGPPDGAISGGEIAGVVVQFGHSCTG